MTRYWLGLMGLLTLGTTTSTLALGNEVKINGEIVPSAFFNGYSGYRIKSQDYCSPNTDIHILKTVIERKLILDAGIAQELETRGTINEEVAVMLKQLESENEADRVYAAVSLLFERSSNYMGHFISKTTEEDVKSKYLYMLAKNDPLVINAVWYRAARLEFSALADAELAMQQITQETTFDAVATSLSLDGTYYEKDKEVWIHSASLPNNLRDKTTNLQTGDVLGPFFKSTRWQLHRVLETRTRPVTLFKDKTDTAYSTVRSALKASMYNEKRDTLVQQLWADATVEVDGVRVTEPYNVDCDESVF